MKVERTVKVELTADELKQIVAEYLRKDGFDAEKEDVTFNVGRHSEGFGMMEHEVIKFTGCTVKASVGAEA